MAKKARIAAAIVGGLFIGVVAAEITSTVLAYSMRTPEMQNCMDRKPLFTSPVEENFARVVARQCQEWRQAHSDIRRFDAANPLPLVPS